MFTTSLTESSTASLHADVQSLRHRECESTADIIRYLAEIDARQVYRDFGYSSLYTYCREVLLYSEGAAIRRVRAARCLQKTPGIYERIKSGAISLCALSEVAPSSTRKIRGRSLPRPRARRDARPSESPHGSERPRNRSVRSSG